MIKRNISEQSNIKIPIRTPRSTKNGSSGSVYPHSLLQKYLQLSNNAVYFWKTQEYLHNKIRSRQLAFLISSRDYVAKYMSFTEIKAKIKDVITERVEKDYLFGTTFNNEFRILQKYTRGQRKLKHRNFFNQYYFSNCPPKISLISQPTTTTLYTIKGPETNSTIQLKALTHTLEIMLKSQKKQRPIFSGEKQRKNEKSQKTIKRRIRSPQEIPEENYGLRNYKKAGKAKSKGRGELSKSKGKLCITPQPHGNISSVGQSPQGIHQRLSERWSSSNRSQSRKNEKGSAKKIF